MKRIAAICFFTLYLVSATEAKQLLKLPVLFEHYAEHKQKNREISFLNFIYMHYAGSDFDDGDQDRDMQLPFKSLTSATALFPAFSPSANGIKLEPSFSIREGSFLPAPFNFQSFYLSSIWQPPKFC